eukprot:TRINITY_DN3902_c0_g1_i5.p1 TRINITY_DN3902_c0_g1~~TRINITY_DN3902_c0_g1_i5.p1  ORF type:complete len:313 (+),score=31.21 TRINITY_DN3902_c0_g1_i5:52-990(+)
MEIKSILLVLCVVITLSHGQVSYISVNGFLYSPQEYVENMIYFPDITGDGLPEVVVLSQNYFSKDPDICVYSPQGDTITTGVFNRLWCTSVKGNTYPLFFITTKDERISMSAVPDINGDNVPDLVVGYFQRDIVQFYYMDNKTNSFLVGPYYSMASPNGYYGAGVTVLKNYGSGSSIVAISHAYTANGTSYSDVSLENISSMSFQVNSFVSTTTVLVSQIASTDLDGNGVTDLIIGARNSGSTGEIIVQLMYTDNCGAFRPLGPARRFNPSDFGIPDFPSIANGGGGLGSNINLLGDLDGDGVEDLSCQISK